MDNERIDQPTLESTLTNHLSDPAIGAFVARFRDITERKHAEEEHLRLAALVESSDDAIIGKTVEGLIMSWNKGAERMYGYTAEEVMGRSVTLLFPADRQDEFATIMQQILRGERIDHYETIWKAPKRVPRGSRPFCLSASW